MTPESLLIRGEYVTFDTTTSEVLFRTSDMKTARAIPPVLSRAYGLGMASGALGWPHDPDAPVLTFSAIEVMGQHGVVVSSRSDPGKNCAMLGVPDPDTAERALAAVRRAYTMGAEAYRTNIVEQLVGQDRGRDSPAAG